MQLMIPTQLMQLMKMERNMYMIKSTSLIKTWIFQFNVDIAVLDASPIKFQFKRKIEEIRESKVQDALEIETMGR